ncbi:MAG: hypothetical protein KAI38_06020, partial [Candidatus Latescibacteria bacterium]|nr:hypothetical protein [Candidatus Latescibacterota bacterium]MCK5733722.1 hypothetical protein [Candidatus Latescibacterota bacterium]
SIRNPGTQERAVVHFGGSVFFLASWFPNCEIILSGNLRTTYTIFETFEIQAMAKGEKGGGLVR